MMGGIASERAAGEIAYRVRTHGGTPGVLGSLRKYPVTIKLCSVCASEFTARGKHGLTKHLCSIECRNEHLRKYKTKSPQYWQDCASCGTNFYARPKGNRPRAKYCCVDCMYKGRNKQRSEVVPCATCGKELRRHVGRLSKNSYCGYNCMAAGRVRELPKTNNPFSVRVWFSRYNRMSECEVCGYGETPRILVLHHKDRNRKNNDLSNLQVLCPNCHAIEHMEENKSGWNHKSTREYTRDGKKIETH